MGLYSSCYHICKEESKTKEQAILNLEYKRSQTRGYKYTKTLVLQFYYRPSNACLKMVLYNNKTPNVVNKRLSFKGFVPLFSHTSNVIEFCLSTSSYEFP